MSLLRNTTLAALLLASLVNSAAEVATPDDVKTTPKVMSMNKQSKRYEIYLLTPSSCASPFSSENGWPRHIEATREKTCR